MNSLLPKLRNLFSCQCRIEYVTSKGGTGSFEFPTAGSIDVCIGDEVKVITVMCSCAEMKSGGCARFKLARNHLPKSFVRENLHVVNGASEIKSDMRDGDGECRTIHNANRQMLLPIGGDKYADWRNQQFYSVVTYSSPSINEAENRANKCNRQCDRLKNGNFLHVIPFKSSQIEKDNTQ